MEKDLIIHISIVVGYRDRDINKVHHCLSAIAQQTFRSFEVVFIDYGSDEQIAPEIKNLVEQYSFAKYYYSFTRGWLWNRAHALNTGLRLAVGEIVLLYDIDLIIEKDFLQKIAVLNYANKFYTFSCFYLPERFDLTKDLEQHGIHCRQDYVGLCAVIKKDVESINGFDEFYMVWGAEDDDLYIKLSEKGMKRIGMKASEYKVFHQFHKSHSPVETSLWYLSMLNYLFSVPKKMQQSWGQKIDANDRPLIKFKETQLDTIHNIAFKYDQKLFMFNSFIEQFFNLKYKTPCYVEYVFMKPAAKNQFRSLFAQWNFSNKKNRSIIIDDKESIRQFFYFFIGMNRMYMEDYFLVESQTSFKFFFIKKLIGQLNQ